MARAFISLTQARVLLEVNGELKNHGMRKFFRAWRSSKLDTNPGGNRSQVISERK